MFSRKCSVCPKRITYPTVRALKRANKSNSKCVWCRSLKPTPIKNCPDCGVQQTYSNRSDLTSAIKNNAKCRDCAWNDKIGKPRSEETIKKISLSRKGTPAWNSGKSGLCSAETRNKMRLSALARLERNHGQIKPNYSPTACKIIEEYGEKNGYNFQHAENGGEFYISELGYWVDGYDKEKNVVIEYYEKHHGRTKERDRQRQHEITNHLRCEFIILHQ